MQRGFYIAGAAGTVVLIFASILAIWDVYDLSTYWRSLSSVGVLIFTVLVCGGTAGLLQKYEQPLKAMPTSPEEQAAVVQHAVLGVVRNIAGSFVIFLFLIHGIFSFFAVWNSHDELFMRAVLSAATFLLGLLVLVAITGAMQFGQKRSQEIGGNVYALIVLLFFLIVIGVFTL